MEIEDFKIYREGENWRKSQDHGTISMLSVQGEYPLVGDDKISVREVWDYSRGELIEQALKLIPESAHETFQQQILAQTNPFHSMWLPAHPGYANSSTQIFTYFYIVSGKIEDLIEYGQRWGLSVMADGMNARGDDTYFDYFPDLMGVYFQFCWGLSHISDKGKEMYEGVVEALYAEGANYDRKGDFADDVTFEEWDNGNNHQS